MGPGCPRGRKSRRLLTEPDETAEAADNGVPVESRQWLATAERASTREAGDRVGS